MYIINHDTDASKEQNLTKNISLANNGYEYET